MKPFSTQRLVLGALFLATALFLPFLTAQIPQIGSALLPMHLPVIICGFVCGGPVGALVGFIAPLLRSIIWGMPPFYPTAFAMAFELATYGFASGFIYSALKKKPINVYIALVCAMVAGRLVWGAVRLAQSGLAGSAFPFSAFLAGAVLNAVPGIVLQLLIVPPIVLALKRAKLIAGS